MTEGYNPQKKEFGATRKLLELLRGSGTDILTCTKFDLVMFDLDLLKKWGPMTVFRLINPVDEAFKDDMDNATGIKRRIVAMKRTYTTSIHTICFVFPIFLGITDFESIFKQAKDQCDLEIEPYRLAVKLSANTRPGGSRSPRWSRCTPRP